MLESFVKLPLKKVFKKHKSIEKDNLLEKINGGFYKFCKNTCLCGNLDINADTILSKNEYIGIPTTTIICRNCGLIRTKKYLDTKSLTDFYKNFYNVLYYKKDKIGNNDFEKEISSSSRSYKLFSLINKKGLLTKIEKVFEVGCSAGWNLYPYHIRNKYVSGCDFEGDRIMTGISKGMDLYVGKLDTNITKYNSQDLVILSHVLEHITKPIEFLIEVIKIIKFDKFLLVEIPSVLSNRDSTLITTFHFPHVYTFNENFLISFFNALNLEVLYHDKESVFILKKPNLWPQPSTREVEKNICSEKLISDSDYIINHLKKLYIKAKFRIIIIRVLEFFLIKKIIKFFLKRLKYVVNH